MDARMDDRAPRIDPTPRRGRKLIDAAFRAITKWRPTCEWRTVVVQPNCAVRIGRLGDVSGRAPSDQRTADGRRRESTVPLRKARSAPTRRTDRSNQRAALHQEAQIIFCRIRLLKLAFRGLRSTAALASTPTTANVSSASSRRTATTTSEPMHDSAETLQAGASGVGAGSPCSIKQVEATSTGKRTVGALDDASSPGRTRCRRGARGGGLDVAQSLPGSASMGDPSTVAFVPSPPSIILSPLSRSPFPPPPPLLYHTIAMAWGRAPPPPTAGGPGPPS